MTDDWASDQRDKCSDSGYVLNAELTEFTGRVDVQYGTEGDIKDDYKVLGLSR